MAITETTQRWSVFLDEALDAAWQAGGDELENIRDKFLKTKDIVGSSYIDYRFGGLGKHAKTPELNPIPFDNYEQGEKRTAGVDKYALGFRISKELLDDIANGDRVRERLEAFKDVTEQLRESAEQTMEELAAQVILQGDSATAAANWVGAGRDGKALFATDHATLKNPVSTVSNLQTSASLSSIQIMGAITTIETTPDDRGYFQKLPKKVVVVAGPYWRHRLYEIQNTDKQLDSNNNNVNPLKGFSIEVVINPNLGSTSKRFMVCTPGDKRYKLMQIVRQKPQFDKEDDKIVLGRVYTSNFRYATNFFDFRGAVLNLGGS